MKKPVIAVSTLMALAYNLSAVDKVIVPMLDARRDEVFTAAYKFSDGDICEIVSPCVMTIDEIKEKYNRQKVIFIGDGALIHRDELCETDFSFAPTQLMETRASALAIAALGKAQKGEVADFNSVHPLYLRKSQAEREYERKKDK